MDPQPGQDPLFDTYRSSTIKKIFDELTQPKERLMIYLKKSEFQSIDSLQNNPHIVIKPADKGGNIAIMNKENYIHEGLR